MLILTSQFNSPCILCNCMPVDETSPTRKPLQMFHAQGVDVNFGEDANVCQICVGVMADMLGRPDAERYKRLTEQHESLQEQYVELQSQHEQQGERISKILEGKRAESAQRQRKVA